MQVAGALLHPQPFLRARCEQDPWVAGVAPPQRAEVDAFPLVVGLEEALDLVQHVLDDIAAELAVRCDVAATRR